MNEQTLLQWTYAGSVLLVAVIQSFLPLFSGEGTHLGIRFSPANASRPEIRGIIKQYVWICLGLGLLLAGGVYGVVGRFAKNYGLQVAVMLIAIVLLLLPIVWANRKLGAWKAAWHDEGPPRVITVSSRISGKKIGLAGSGLWIYLLSFFVIVLGTAYLLMNYDRLPDRIPTHFNVQGQADAWSEKRLLTALAPSLVNLLLLVTILASNIALLSAKQKLEPADPEGSLNRYLKARKIWTYYLGIMTLAFVAPIQFGTTDMMLGGERLGEAFIWIILGISVLAVVAAVVLGVKVGTVGEKLSGAGVASFDADDDKWKLGGLFYYNKEDPAVFVPKRVGVGMTLNMGSPGGKVAVIVLLLIIILPLLIL